MSKVLSVIICTHNPRKDYLERVLESLRNQTFPYNDWEFLLIDNCSSQPIAKGLNLNWHPNARIVREENLGLTQARIRGIRESSGSLLVFVDDDNLLREDYLVTAWKFSQDWPQLGAWSGRVVPEYEVAPAAELMPYIWMLCIRPVEKPSWGNTFQMETTPWGAGMCVRRNVAEFYARSLEHNPDRANLDRRGQGLGSTGDMDLALTSLDLGLGTGVFPELELRHLISERRVQESYLLKLVEDGAVGDVIFQASRGILGRQSESRVDKLVRIYKILRGSRIQKAFGMAFERGRKQGLAILKSFPKSRAL
jgi:glycosyltransferase involved in cell wall biosynthesis